MDVLNKDKPEVRLRAFRAIDDPGACEFFFQGHEKILTSIGVKKVTSSNTAWMSNPASFVLIVESLDGSRIYGGARVEVAGGTEPLPIEKATIAMDPTISNIVGEYAKKGTGEICGLWNSREIAGYGIGSIFLFRAALATCSQIGLTSLFGLCAPYTLKMATSVGFRVLQSVGNNGTFYYPKLDLLATAVYMPEVISLKDSVEEDRTAILKLRNNLKVVVEEELRHKKMVIHYDLQIPNLNQWNLQAITANYVQQKTSSTFDEKNINLL